MCFRVWERPQKTAVCLRRLTGIDAQSCPLSLRTLLCKKTQTLQLIELIFVDLMITNVM